MVKILILVELIAKITVKKPYFLKKNQSIDLKPILQTNKS